LARYDIADKSNCEYCDPIKINELYYTDSYKRRMKVSSKVDVFPCPHKIQSVVKSHEGFWSNDKKCGDLATTTWFSGLVYQGSYVNDNKHGNLGKLDFKNVDLNEK